jgi:hypothetical protein
MDDLGAIAAFLAPTLSLFLSAGIGGFVAWLFGIPARRDARAWRESTRESDRRARFEVAVLALTAALDEVEMSGLRSGAANLLADMAKVSNAYTAAQLLASKAERLVIDAFSTVVLSPVYEPRTNYNGTKLGAAILLRGWLSGDHNDVQTVKLAMEAALSAPPE